MKQAFLLFSILVSALMAGGFLRAQSVPNMRIDERDSLLVYYPNYEKVDMVCGKNVPASDDILYCCASAFTAKCLKEFRHHNIRRDHVSGGHFFNGSAEPVCNGFFSFYDGKGHYGMASQNDFKKAAAKGGMGFCQVIVILNGELKYANAEKKTFWIKKDYVFRALCEKDGRLCIAESKYAVSYAQFANYLVEYGFDNAINLDMGGWSHAWWRNNDGKIVTTNAIPTRYASNWLIFKK